MHAILGILAAALYAGAALACWRLGARLGAKLGKRAGEAVAAAAVLATVASVLLVNWFPTRLPAALVASPAIHLEFSYFPPPVLVLFGIASVRAPRKKDVPALRALGVVVGLYGAGHVCLSLGAAHHPDLMASPPPSEVCRQSQGWSCGAAASVTLLRLHGIASTEREMGELCLTMPFRGTTMPRFVRGFTRKLRQEGSPLRVRAEDRLKVSDLDTFPVPCLLAISFSPLVDHAVVLTGRDAAGNWLLADPLDGVVKPEPPDSFARRFTGEAVALVR